MLRLRLSWLLGWMLIAPLIGNVQPLPLKYYTVNEGLVSNSIRRIFQDSQGYLWIATLDGLSKYDGYRFTNYTRANGMPWDLVNDMLETDDGQLIFACNDGHLVWIHNNRIVKTAKPGPVINRFLKTASGVVLAATDKQGIHEWKGEKLLKPAQPFPNDDYYSLHAVNDSILLAGSGASVQLLTTNLELIYRYELASFSGEENRAFSDSRGRLWTSHFPGFAQLGDRRVLDLPAALRILPLSASANIRQIYEDSEANIWVAGILGLVQIGANNRVNVFGKKDGLLSDQVNWIVEDREDNLWIGTSQGLCKLPAKNRASNFTIDAQNNLYLFSTVEEGLIAVATDNWRQFDFQEKKWRIMDQRRKADYVLYEKIPGNPPLLTNKGRLVPIGSSAGRIFRQYLNQVEGFLYHVIQDSSDHYFLSNATSFYIYDGQKIIRDTSYRYNINGMITGMAIDKTGHLWIATWNNGLIRLKYDKKNAALVVVDRKSFLPGELIRYLHIDANDKVWVGTRNSGLFQLTKKGNDEYAMEQWTTRQGLSSNWIQHIASDEKGNIWMAYTYGIDKLVKQEDGDYRVFNFSRIHNYFETVSRILPQPGAELWLIGNNGFMMLKDGELENQQPWPVLFSEIQVADSVYHPENMPLELAHRQNSLRIAFSSPSYINEMQVMYSYRLWGAADTNWSAPHNLHSVSFASLRPGDYRFEVRTMGWNGEWGPISSIGFSILHPWWQRNWVQLIALLLLAFTISWLVRRRIRYIRHEAEMQQQLAETEMMALRAQMNPHFLFNSLNAIDSLIQTRQTDKATTYLGRFAKLLRLVLNSSKSKWVSFDKDFTAIKLYLDMERFRSGGKFQFEIEVDPELLHGGYSVPPLLVQPFIENAIYHGLMNKQTGDRKLQIKISHQDDYIIYQITDNGVGRARAKELNALNRPEHVSYGLQIAEQRLGLNNGGSGQEYIRIHDLHEEGSASGTCVELKIKVHNH